MTKTAPVDPLYTIFEQHLYNFQDSEADRKSFIASVVQDYFAYLRKMNITIPKSLEEPILEELGAQVNLMLVKKIYGFLTIQEYQRSVPTGVKRRVKSRYGKLGRQRAA